MRIATLLTAATIFIFDIAICYAEPTIEAYLIPHSHDDPGWLRNVDEYHNEYVRYILDNTVDALLQNTSRKFIQVEVSFFARWWKEQTPARKAQVLALVERHQLEFVNGGWVMADEACPTYENLVDALTLGHKFLQRELNISTRIGWHIDPFGASATMPQILIDMGYEAFVINRIHYQLKSAWQSHKKLEFMWQPSRSRPNATLFTHVLDSHYSSPWGFDWEYFTPGQSNSFDLADENPAITTQATSPMTTANVAARATVLADMIKLRASYFQHSRVLVPMGDDFKWVNPRVQYDNMDKLIQFINARPDQFNIQLRYATLNEYFDAIKPFRPATPYKDKTALRGTSMRKQGDSQSTMSVYTGDFFPYAFAPAGGRFDQPGWASASSYWSGFYTSRPQLKGRSREALASLHTMDMVNGWAEPGSVFGSTSAWALLRRNPQASDQTPWDVEAAREASSLLMHHDAITGTANPGVVKDYLDRVVAAWHVARNQTVFGWLSLAQADRSHPVDTGTSAQQRRKQVVDTHPQAQEPSFHVSYDDSLLQTVCSAPGRSAAVVVWNSLATRQEAWVELPLNCSNIAAFQNSAGHDETPSWVPLHAQLTPNYTAPAPTIPFDSKTPYDTARPPAPAPSPHFWLHATVEVPAGGYTTFFVASVAETAGSPPGDALAPVPIAQLVDVAADIMTASDSPVAVVSNDAGTSLAVDIESGCLAWFAACDSNVTFKAPDDNKPRCIGVYHSVENWPFSDRYLMIPQEEAAVRAASLGPAKVQVLRGPVVVGIVITRAAGPMGGEVFIQEAYNIPIPSDPTTSTAGEQCGADVFDRVRVRRRLGVLQTGVEVVVIHDTGDSVVASGSTPTMYTDANGLEMQQRVLNQPHWISEAPGTYFAEPVAANIYPIPHCASLRGAAQSFSVISDRPQGAMSLEAGRLELLVHRRVNPGGGFSLDDVSVLDLTHWLVAGLTADRLDSVTYREAIDAAQRPLTYWFGAPTSSSQDPLAQASTWLMQFTGEASVLSNVLASGVVDVLSLAPVERSKCTVDSPWSFTSIRLCRLLRIRHKYAVDENPMRAAPVDVDLRSLFSTIGNQSVVLATEVNLAGQPLRDTTRTTSNPFVVTLGPTVTRTFYVALV